MWNVERESERGSSFFVVTVFAVIAVVLVGSHLTASLAKVRHVQQQVHEASAFNAAESGLNAAIAEVWTLYRSQTEDQRVASLDLLDGKSEEQSAFSIADRKIGRSQFDVLIKRVRAVGNEYADVEFVSVAGNGKAMRTIRAVVRFGRKPSRVFDHAYFINNFGWLWGAGITVNGSVRSNGNFSVRNATVNGDLFASENEDLGAAGTVTGSVRTKDIDWYNSHYGTMIRPTNPSAPSEDINGNGVLDAGEDRNGNERLDEYAFLDGYDGEAERLERQKSIQMPYLGDLQIYRELAISKGGSISQGGDVIVSGVLGDHPSEDKDLLIVGTESDPIIVDGPVVVTNDLVLKGVITGRGTIYAGRNVHIIGDLVYKDPPVWPKPMVDREAVKEANATRDMVGLAAKGSIILGDYTSGGWKSVTRYYQRPPFTQAYEVDPTDDVNGYVTHYDNGRPMFNGNYTAYDGGQKDGDQGNGNGNPQKVSRRFFESSFSDEVIGAAADNQVRRVDGVLYTNHLLSGKVGAATFNGTLVSRDEAMIYHGSLFINYDIRVRHGGYEFLDIYLPREPTHRILYWSEGN